MPRGKKAGTKGKETRRKDKRLEEETERESGSEMSEVNLEHPSSAENDVFPTTLEINKFTEAQDELIAAFFEDHPAFYDLTNPDYKKKAKKNALLKEFEEEIGLPRQ